MDRDPSSRPVAIVASARAGRRSALQVDLEACGFTVRHAETPIDLRAALEAPEGTRLAFIDVDLGAVEGPSTTEVIRALQPRIAVYVVTDDAGEDDALASVEAGARGLLFERHLDSPLVSSIASGVMTESRLEHSIQLAESAVLESEYRYRALLGLARDPMFMVDVEGTIIEANEVAAELFGQADESLVGRRVLDLVPRESDRDRIRAALAFDADDSDVALQVSRIDAAGDERALTMVARPRRDVFGRPHGLFCSVAPPREMGGGATFALLFVEVAGVDVLEEPKEGPTGDDIAAALSNRMVDALREGDIVSRVGVDEFVVLLGEIEEKKMASIVAERLRSQLSEPLTIGNRRIRLDCSIGGRTLRTGAERASASEAAATGTSEPGAGVVLLEFPRRREGGTIVGAPPNRGGRGARRANRE